MCGKNVHLLLCGQLSFKEQYFACKASKNLLKKIKINILLVYLQLSSIEKHYRYALPTGLNNVHPAQYSAFNCSNMRQWMRQRQEHLPRSFAPIYPSDMQTHTSNLLTERSLQDRKWHWLECIESNRYHRIPACCEPSCHLHGVPASTPHMQTLLSRSIATWMPLQAPYSVPIR